MQNNIFLLSDANYSSITKIAGIRVIDTNTKKEYCFTINNINTSHEAQYRAVLCSVNIALKNHYQNVVFGYDYKNLDLTHLKEQLKGKFHCAQFLWLKKAHHKHPNKILKSSCNLEFSNDTSNPDYLNNNDIYEAFTKYSASKIIRSFTAIANKEQKIFLMTFLRNKPHVSIPIRDENISFYKTIYHLLEKKSRINFLKFIENHYGGLLNQHNFTQPSDKNQYIKEIKYVLKTIQNKRERIIESISEYFADDISMIAV